MNEDFAALLGEAAELEARKRADYGRADDKYANYRASEAWGIPAWVNACLRMQEKFTRLQSFVLNGKLENEPLEDALLDLAVGALIALDLHRESQPSQLDGADSNAPRLRREG